MNESNDHIDSPPAEPFSTPARLGYVFVAAVSSLAWSGLGQVYTRNWKRAAAYFVLTFGCWFFLAGWLVHLASIVDAIVTTWKATGEPDARADDPWEMVWTVVFLTIAFATLGAMAVVIFGNTDLAGEVISNWSAVING